MFGWLADTMYWYMLVSASVWCSSIVWMSFAIYWYDLYHFLWAFAFFWLYPIVLEMLLNIWGFLSSSSLRAFKHRESCVELTQNKFPIIYSHDYRCGLFYMERLHGLDSLLAFYVYKKIEQEEIIDTKSEERDL